MEFKREIKIIHPSGVFTIVGDDDLGGGVKIVTYDADETLSGELCFDIDEAIEISNIIIQNYAHLRSPIEE